jgi:DNA-binding beta-propeller fold protein YncE
MVIVGTGAWSYQVVEGWPRLPEAWSVRDVAGVAVDAQDRVYVFNRGEHPVIVLAPDGSVLDTWGEGQFSHPHAIHIAADQTVFCTDDGAHTVSRHTLDGRLLMRLGEPGRASGFHSGRPFSRCTHTALSPQGDIYVTDGYHNHRVHKFSPAGELLLSWGASGVGPGEFNFPHNVVCDADGRVYVADRENHRIQVFGGDGEFETEWRDLHRPSALFLLGGGELGGGELGGGELGGGELGGGELGGGELGGGEPRFVVGEIGPVMRFNRGAPNLGPRLSVLDAKGQVLARIGTEPAAGVGPGQFLSPHAVAADSRGNLYVAEVAETAWPQLFPGEPMPDPLRCLQKLAPVAH